MIVDSECEIRTLSYLPAVIGYFQVVICLLVRWHSFSTSTSKQAQIFLRDQTLHFSWWYTGRNGSCTEEFTSAYWLVLTSGAAYMKRPVTTAICYDLIFSNWGWGSPILFETVHLYCTITFRNITHLKEIFFGNNTNNISSCITCWWKCRTWEIPSSFSITPRSQE